MYGSYVQLSEYETASEGSLPANTAAEFIAGLISRDFIKRIFSKAGDYFEKNLINQL